MFLVYSLCVSVQIPHSLIYHLFTHIFMFLVYSLCVSVQIPHSLIYPLFYTYFYVFSLLFVC